MEMELKQKIPQLHKTTNPKHREDYVFVEKPGEDFTALKLISGPFSSIVYKYGAVGFRPESEKRPDGTLPMQFDYDIIENNIEADIDSQEFINHIGDILVVLLDEKLKEDKRKLEVYIQSFFSHFLKRLGEEPGELPVIINELVPFFVEHQIRIRFYEAFRQIRAVEDLITTLEKISSDNELENFELFCSAIFVFYCSQSKG